MQKKGKRFFLIPVVVLVASLIAFIIIAIFKSNFENGNISIRQLKADSGNNYVYETLLNDGSVICADYFSESAKYYRYYYDSETVIEIGTIKNFVLNMSGMVQINNSLYFFCYVEDNGEMVNTLFSIDIASNTLSSHPKFDASVAGIPVFLYGDNVATMKNIVEENLIYTFVDWYDRDADEWHQEHLNTYNSETREGSAIVLMYSDDNSLYLLRDIYTAPGVYETHLEEYDFAGNELRSVVLSEEITEYFQQGRMFRLYIVDNYIYLSDVSGYGYLGNITGSAISTICAEQYLTLPATNELEHEKVIFFVRRTNTGYILDVKTGQFTEFYLELPEDQSICQLLVGEKDMVINCYKEYDNDILYKAEIDFVLSSAFSVPAD